MQETHGYSKTAMEHKKGVIARQRVRGEIPPAMFTNTSTIRSTINSYETRKIQNSLTCEFHRCDYDSFSKSDERVI